MYKNLSDSAEGEPGNYTEGWSKSWGRGLGSEFDLVDDCHI